MNADTGDVFRHFRIDPEDDIDPPVHGPNGQFIAVLPPFERVPKFYDPMQLCACGRHRGAHRFGDEACPNPAWKPGNGRADFLETTFRPAP